MLEKYLSIKTNQGSIRFMTIINFFAIQLLLLLLSYIIIFYINCDVILNINLMNI
jgi:hypothetical protein